MRVREETTTRININQMGSVYWFGYRRVTAHYCFFPRRFRGFQVATLPQEYHGIILSHVFCHRQVRPDTRMNEQEFVHLVVEQCLTNEGNMLFGKGFSFAHQSVTGQRLDTTVDGPKVVFATVEVAEQQLFVIASKKDTIVLVLEANESVDDAFRVRSTVYVVANEQQRVIRGGCYLIEQRIQGEWTTMYISDGNDTYAETSPLFLAISNRTVAL